MERNLSVFDNIDEDYIDMEVSSSKTFFCYSPHPREFEFPGSLERERTTSPADELFYKGNLLPLHLPPRLQMVQKLLENKELEPFLEDNYIISTSLSRNTTTFNTPLESCNISPSESCRVSRELIPDEYFFDCTNELSRFIDENPKRSWCKKLKLIKQYSSFGHKLKASKAYLKSLFSKSGCSVESCTVATASNGTEGTVTIGKECLKKYIKVAKKNPFGQIQVDRYQESSATAKRGTHEREKMIEDGSGHRRSFSGAIKRHSATKSSSSSSSSSSSNSSCSSFSSSNSNGFYDLHLLKRSSSATNSEIENSVQGAIAHCKQSSQQHFQLIKTTSEVGLCSRIAACEDQGRPGLCRG
ncbi:hypothetical protein AQUCO_01000655v1 [Aquilegia coerulea]|uniref:Membrane-associated kinase regulator 4 n=1 Tax=Aquilegia coerulea TaxID=218851 RepID=A0A2G5EB11_AQUCA|nr:hypothetical protein AQUCO_01000655v1 [Aquilegia coerulea]